MALPDEDWLHIAQRLAVGQRTRVHHGRERRPNLVIGNEAGHYWAYCQACRDGGKVQKTHVLTARVEPPKSRVLSLPDDMVQLQKVEPHTQAMLVRFLASKGVDALYLPALHYTDERKRLLMQVQANTGVVWTGRDVTGASHQKWLVYSRAEYVRAGPRMGPDVPVVLVEDLFSMYKVHWAVPQVAVVCCLGTGVRPALALEICTRNPREVLCLFDGDSAGRRASQDAHRLLRPFVRVRHVPLPDEHDPKNLSINQLQELLLWI